MRTRGPIWKVCVRTTSEAEDAVTEMLQEVFGQPASSYTDVETGEVTVAVYIVGEKRRNTPALSRHGGTIALKSALQEIERCGLNIGPGEISVTKVRREDWAESWKRHFKPIEIRSALLIKPSWSQKRPKRGQAVMVLDPGLSFGTGQHPTTAFCLRELVGYLLRTPVPKPSLLDIGTGSGILAIAAAKLGFATVEALDFDPEAVRIARENARKNGVSPKVNIRREDVTELPSRSNRKFEVVCANLISNILIAERRRIVARLQKGGVLVLAGILNSEFAVVQSAYEDCGMQLITSRKEKEWRSGAFKFANE